MSSKKKWKDHILENYRFDESNKTYYCNECKYSTKRDKYIRSHLVSHSAERPFVCDHSGCDQSFKRPNHLKRHVNVVHKGIRQYVCHICGQAMTQSQTLKYHISNIHKGIKPFVCHINGCLKVFGLKKNMISHQRRRHFMIQLKSDAIVEDNEKTNDNFDVNENKRQRSLSDDQFEFASLVMSRNRSQE